MIKNREHRERREDKVIAESEAVLESLRQLTEQLENYTADLRAEGRRRITTEDRDSDR